MVLRIIEEEWKVAQQITDSTDKQLNGKIHILDLQNKFEEVMTVNHCINGTIKIYFIY